MARLFESLRVFAKRDDEIVHQEAVGAGDLFVGAYGLGKSTQNEKPVGGKFARIFSRRIVARRQGVGQHFDEARQRLCLEPAQGFLLAGRDEAGNRNHALLCLCNDFIYGFGVFFEGFLASEAHREKHGRGNEREIADGIPCAILRENRVANIGAAQEAIGIARLPKRAGGVELDVAPEGFELARREGEHEPEAVVPKRRGFRPEPRNGGIDFGRGCRPEPWRGGIDFGRGCCPGELAEFVDPPHDIKIGGFIVIHDQNQMHVIRHDDEIGGRHGWVARMGVAPHLGNCLASLRQRNRGIFIDARENLSPIFGAESEKEEFHASPMEIQFHGDIIAKIRGFRPEPRRGGESIPWQGSGRPASIPKKNFSPWQGSGRPAPFH